METLLLALRARMPDDALVRSLTAAADEFEQVARAHAGSRTHLDLLLQAQPDAAEERSEVRWRERAFLGNSFIWGAQAKVTLGLTLINFAARKRDWIDVAQVRGLVGLRRVRPNLHWVVNQSVVLNRRKRVTSPKRRPLDEVAARAMDGVPVLPDFCSKPCPALRRRLSADGLVNDELLPAPVGASGQQTILLGEVLRELAPRHATEARQRAHFGSVSRTPSELLLLDHFVHRDLFPEVTRELCVFGEINSPVTMAEDDRLPVGDTIEALGAGVGAARTSDVPGYLELVRWTFDRLGWDATQFDLYRVRMAYPPVPASVMVRHPLPEKGADRRASTPPARGRRSTASRFRG
ncbi:MAG: hypothetical protein U0527_04480 [Candidatus Eisenbacteria bacterium]